MLLDQFLRNPAGPNRAHVREPGFSLLYVRRGRLFVGLQRTLGPVLDIANVEADPPGHGAFTGLLERLARDFPDWGVYVENAHVRLGRYLLRRGFRPSPVTPDSYYKAASATGDTGEIHG